MLVFVYVFGGAISTQAAPGAQSPAYVDYVVLGIMLLCAGYGSSMTAVSVNSDMRNGVIDRFQSMPIVSSAVLTGHVTAALLRNTVSMLLVVGTAALLGFRPEAGVLDWVVAAGPIWLFMLAIGWLSAAIGLLTSSWEAAGGATFCMLFVPYLSSAFVPTQTMPSALQWVSENQPVTPVIETLRGLLTGTPCSGAAASPSWGTCGRPGCSAVVAGDHGYGEPNQLSRAAASPSAGPESAIGVENSHT
jgi:ABC-2 type transport system permease protein